jgi:hypothetical protein
LKILITGATGFVGTALVKKLLSEGHELAILTRNSANVSPLFKNPKISIFEWKETNSLPPQESIKGINGVINLMGENIAAKRWSPEQKKVLFESRVNATKNLISVLDQNLNLPLDFFISSSAVGIYPVNLSETLTEESKIGRNYLAGLCQEWEDAASTMKKVKRLVIIRTGVVLEKHGGALSKMLPPFKFGLGGPIGDGNQFMSWIHLNDLVNIYLKAATDNTFVGIYNGVAPLPTNNFDFTKALGHALNRPTIFPVPALALKLAMGEMSSIILDSQKIISSRLANQNFVFEFESISTAMNSIFGKK